MGRGDVNGVAGAEGPDDVVWASIVEVLPHAPWREGVDEGESWFVHLLVVAANEAATEDLVVPAMRDHDAEFVGFALLEPLEARMARGVVDPAWADFANELDLDAPLMCAGIFDTSEFVRPLEREEDAVLWGGVLVVADDGEEELMGAIAVGSRVEEFQAAAADYIERLGVEVVGWESSQVLVETHVGGDVVEFFDDSTIYTSTTSPRQRGGDIWRGVVEVDLRQAPDSPDVAVGGFVPVLACAETEADFRKLTSHWYEQWGSPAVDFLDVEVLAERSRLPDFAKWLADHFGFFHGVVYQYLE